MSMYVFPKWVCERIDRTRRRFFWTGTNDQGNASNLAAWGVICKPKWCGGLGILDLYNMNRALIGRWLWRWFEQPNPFWKQIIYHKYYINADLLDDQRRKLSSFWGNIMKQLDVFLSSTKSNTNKGNNTFFWLDKWCSENTLASLFPQLFELCEFPRASVAWSRKKIGNTWIWNIKFIRQLQGALVLQYLELLHMIQSVSLSVDEDKRMWKWDHKGYSVKSFYQFLSDGGLRYRYDIVWKIPIPLKIKILLWLAINDRLNTKKNLLKKGLQIDSSFVLCDYQEESNNHIFIDCVYVKSIWKSIKYKFHINSDFVDMKDLWSEWRNKFVNDENKLHWDLYVSAVVWAVWYERNLRIFQHKKNHSLDLLHKINHFVNFWIGQLPAKYAGVCYNKRRNRRNRVEENTRGENAENGNESIRIRGADGR